MTVRNIPLQHDRRQAGSAYAVPATYARLRRMCAPLFALALCATTATAAPPAFRGGLYQGTVDAAGELSPAQVRFTRAGTGWTAQVQIAGRAEALPATVAIHDRRVQLDLPGPNGPLACQGELREHAIVATAAARDCRLELVAAQDGTLAQTLAGGWRDADGHVYAIARMGDTPQPLWFDYRTGDVRAVVERDGALHFGPGTGTLWPRHASLVPKGDALWLRPAKGGAARRLERLPIVEQPLAWTAGDATLKGTLLLPAALPHDARVPVVVFTHMSGAGERDAYRQFAYFFLARGIGALIYDRRGSGESGGTEATAGMHRLADDAVAAIDALKAQPHVDATRIGTFGHSQGGWIAPIAAARSPAIAFVIAQSAPGMSPAQQEIYRVGQSARAAGLDEAEIAAAIDYETRLMEWVRSGKGREQIHALAKANANAHWARFVELREDLPAEPSARSQTFWLFDPRPDLERVRVPILLIHGDRDAYVPVEESRAILRKALADAPAEFQLLPRAAHGLWLGETDSGREAMHSPGLHPDYWPLLLKWLQQQGLAPSRNPNA